MTRPDGPSPAAGNGPSRLKPKAMNPLRLGLVVNPIAGLGGTVGLKGTDTPDILQQALARGAVAQATSRACDMLRAAAAALGGGLEVVAAAGAMGETAARAAGLTVRLVHGGEGETSAEDTAQAAAEMMAQSVALLLFAGGDGTARDIYRAVGERLPVLGVPAGVKMHSGVYATNPRAAGELAARYLQEGLATRPVEVMDLDEEAYRAGTVATQLYGYLSVPYDPIRLQGIKIGKVSSDAAALGAIAVEVSERMRPGELYILGPGTTTRAIARELDLEKTLLGVDLIRDGQIVAADANAQQIEQAVEQAGGSATVVVTPIGGQGHIFGRGNQQIGQGVLRRLGRERILVVATPQKLESLQGRALQVDTGNSELDRALSGYQRVITGHRRETVYAVGG